MIADARNPFKRKLFACRRPEAAFRTRFRDHRDFTSTQPTLTVTTIGPAVIHYRDTIRFHRAGPKSDCSSLGFAIRMEPLLADPANP